MDSFSNTFYFKDAITLYQELGELSIDKFWKVRYCCFGTELHVIQLKRRHMKNRKLPKATIFLVALTILAALGGLSYDGD